jgi:hypothetical protein
MNATIFVVDVADDNLLGVSELILGAAVLSLGTVCNLFSKRRHQQKGVMGPFLIWAAL